MKVAMIARSSLFQVKGGDSIQLRKTAEGLQALGVDVSIYKASDTIRYEEYDLLHLFNIIRPADHLKHIARSGKPYVISTIYLDYSDFDRHGRSWLYRLGFNLLGKYRSEYLKNLYRFVRKQDHMVSPSYLLGHKRAIRKVLARASMLLPNSASEYERLKKDIGIEKEYRIITNGIDQNIFGNTLPERQRERKVLCVAQIYGMKNQHLLIQACKELGYKLVIIGKTPPNHSAYYDHCRQIADQNIEFIDFIPQPKLAEHYASAEVHALPSWFETTGLSSLEAAAMGCKLVVGKGGDTYSYFGDQAWYCDPSDPGSIRTALKSAMESPQRGALQQKVLEKHTWEVTAKETLSAYKQVLHGKS